MQVDSDSDQGLEDFDDDMLPGSDSSDDVMGSEGDDVINGDDVIPSRGPRQHSAKDIAALAAAAHQQAAAYAARQRKAAAAAAGVQGLGEQEEGEGLSDDVDMDGEGGSSEEEGEEGAAADGKRPHIYNAGKTAEKH